MELSAFFGARQSYWTLEEAAQLCLGFEPLPVPEYDEIVYSAELPHGVEREVEDLYDIICRAQVMYEFETVLVDSAIVVKPLALLRWCKSKDLPFDEDLAQEISDLSQKRAEDVEGLELSDSDLNANVRHGEKSEEEASEGEPKLRHRPPKYDWDLFYAEIIRIANTPDGLPETQATLKDNMLSWFNERFGEEPSDSSVKKKIIKIYKYLDEVKKSLD